jgi:hypothetical protein
VPGALLSSAESLLSALVDFEPRVHSAADCLVLVDVLARVEKVCAAARARTAARVAACGAHRAQGFRSPADWLAAKTGGTVAEAERDLATARTLDDLPHTKEALANGDISMAAADEVRKTEAQCPGSEKEMVERAKTHGLRRTKEQGRAKRLAAITPDELHRRQHEARSFRHWKNDMGMVCGSFELPPEVGVPIVNRLDVATDRQFRIAHREGRVEARECYAADALVDALNGEGQGHATRADVVFVADVGTGKAHVVGGGPVPMATVRAAAKDAFVKAVLHDGVKVDTIVHYGRKALPAHLRSVIELGDPPEFGGPRCVDCGSPFGIERDHVDPVANGGRTCSSNIAPRCRRCHHAKTERDRLEGLLGRPP